MIKQIIDAVDNIEELYYRLILIVGQKDEHSDLPKKVAEAFHTKVINLNLELSRRLKEKTTKQRRLHLSKMMDDILKDESISVVDHLGILFDVELEQDPLRLLESLSRNRTMVLFWQGQMRDGKLTYAVPGHPEYKSYDAKELVIVETRGGEKR